MVPVEDSKFATTMKGTGSGIGILQQLTSYIQYLLWGPTRSSNMLITTRLSGSRTLPKMDSLLQCEMVILTKDGKMLVVRAVGCIYDYPSLPSVMVRCWEVISISDWQAAAPDWRRNRCGIGWIHTLQKEVEAGPQESTSTSSWGIGHIVGFVGLGTIGFYPLGCQTMACNHAYIVAAYPKKLNP